MRIDIFSDIACPWCYIGKRRLEAALAEFEHADQIEVVWRSYQLDPSAPSDSAISTLDALGAKFPGGPEQVKQMLARTQGIAAEEGLSFGGHTFHYNTLDAHRLLHLALELGGPAQQNVLKEALFAAHFTDNLNLGDAAVLAQVAIQAGLDQARVAAVLAGSEYAAAVQADIEQARAYGSNGVPFFVVDAKYGISGAQPKEAFAQAIAQAWSESRPSLTVLAAEDAENCGPDGCAI